MDRLRQFDEKYALDSEIETVQRVDMKTGIERGASKMRTSHNIDAAKEGALSAIDRGAAKLKHVVEVITETTKDIAAVAQDNVHLTGDYTMLNVDLVKEGAQKSVELAREKARENMVWARAKTHEGKEKLIEAVHKTQERVRETVHDLGESVRTALTGSDIIEEEQPFNTAVQIAAATKSVDMEALEELDAKYQLDANISTAQKVDIGTEIERSAAKMHTINKIASVKENVKDVIDRGADSLKQQVETVAESTKAATQKTQENAYLAQDKAQQIAEEYNADWAKNKLYEGKEKVQDALRNSMNQDEGQAIYRTETVQVGKVGVYPVDSVKIGVYPSEPVTVAAYPVESVKTGGYPSETVITKEQFAKTSKAT